MAKRMNPFIVTGKIPAEYFCDRVAEAETLLMALTNQNNVVLTSVRRMGKTSLVDFVLEKEEIKNNYVTVNVDILHTTTFREFIFSFGMGIFNKVASTSEKMKRLFASTIKSLSASFGYDPVIGTITFDIKLGDIVNPSFTLEEIFSFLESSEKPCIIVIDEFQQITKYPEKNVEALLRSHIQRSSANFVFSGSQRRIMEEMFLSVSRPFYQSARLLPLYPIDMTVYQDFASRLFREGDKSIDINAIESVYKTFGGVTLYLQRIMKDAYSVTAAGSECSIDTVNNLSQSFINENDSRLRDMLSYISEPQKELLFAVHSEKIAKNISSAAFTRKHRLKSPSATQSAAIKLLEYDLLTREGKTYRIADPLLSLWLDKELHH